MSFVLEFGKHKGKRIQDAPIDYVVWLAGFYLNGIECIDTYHNSAYKYVQTKQSQIVLESKKYLQNRCFHCGGKLVPIGNARENGADHEDWDQRILHKKCFKEILNGGNAKEERTEEAADKDKIIPDPNSACGGYCFEQDSPELETYHKIKACPCILYKCDNRKCKNEMPAWVKYCYHGYCFYCDLNRA